MSTMSRSQKMRLARAKAHELEERFKVNTQGTHFEPTRTDYLTADVALLFSLVADLFAEKP